MYRLCVPHVSISNSDLPSVILTAPRQQQKQLSARKERSVMRRMSVVSSFMPQHPDFLSIRMLVTVHFSLEQQRGDKQRIGQVVPSHSTVSPGTSACPSALRLFSAGAAGTGA